MRGVEGKSGYPGTDDTRSNSQIGGKTLACVDRELRNNLRLFAADPYISHAFRGAREGAKTFSWDGLDEYNIFLRIPADKVDQWGGAIALMYAQLIRHLERRPDKYSKEGEKCVDTLLMMDEFPRLGKMEMITSAMATLRSRKVNICLMIQSVAQLDKIYGSYDRRIIFDNCQYQVILRANDPETQKYLAELIGTRICRQNSVGETLDQDLKTAGYSRSVAEARDWAVCPHELATLKDVLVLSPYGFCRANKVLPDSGLWCRVLAAVPGIACVNGRPTLDSPIFPRDIEEPRRNEGAKMLTVEERAAIVMPRSAAEGRFQPPQESKQVFQMEDPKCFSRAAGEVILQIFSKLWDLEEDFQKGGSGWRRLLEDILVRLADKRPLMEEMKREVRWPGFKDGSVYVREQAAIVMPRPATRGQIQPPQESKRVFQKEDPKCFSRAVGELVLQIFPELWDLEEDFQKGGDDWRRLLEDISVRLIDNQQLMEEIKREVRWPGFKDGNV